VSEWQLQLFLILGSLILLMMSGIPVAFCFLAVVMAGAFLLWGGEAGLSQLILSFRDSITNFSLLPVPLFLLMGEVMFLSGIAPRMMNTLDMLMGRLPGRLALLAVSGGTLFATLSGSSMASVAMLGSTLLPEMERRGYKKPMSLGPILGSGGLAVMIPPSALAVILGAIGDISIGKLLIAIIIPGLLMAAFYAVYVIMRCYLQPSLAPSYSVPYIPISDKLKATLRNILPLGGIIFLVIGLIFVGVATPTEAAATGTLGAFILAFANGCLNWDIIKKSFSETIRTTAMIFTIIMGANAFGQILAFTGSTQSLIEFTTAFSLSPIALVIIMQGVGIFLGMFMGPVAIMMITLPIFMPIITALDLNPVWFGTLYLLNMEMSATTPPFGMSLFVMQGIAPAGTTFGDIVRAGLPFLYCNAIIMALIIAFPGIALWLPGVMSQ
jgi:tripartite ATP-independent transporter DctM subunit